MKKVTRGAADQRGRYRKPGEQAQARTQGKRDGKTQQNSFDRDEQILYCRLLLKQISQSQQSRLWRWQDQVTGIVRGCGIPKGKEK